MITKRLNGSFCVAQISDSAVSQISKSAGDSMDSRQPSTPRPADLEVGDTADSEVCATIFAGRFNVVTYTCIAGAWLALCASGCAHFDPKPVSAEANAEKLENRSLTNADLQTFVSENLHNPAPSNSWDLDGLTWAAFYYHPSLEVARAQLLVAQGGELTAGQRPNPVLTVAPQYDVTTLTPSPWIVTATLDVPIETAGKRGHRRAH